MFIIFQNGELKGYLKSEAEVKSAVHNLSEFLVEDLRKVFPNKTRIFLENREKETAVYTQELGIYYDGGVVKRYTISWKELAEYTDPQVKDLAGFCVD